MLNRPTIAAAALAALATIPTGGARAQEAASPAAMQPYAVTVDGAELPMVPIPVGTEGYPAEFRIGSPDGEAGRKDDEGPQRTINVAPFWMGKYEITWDLYDRFRAEYVARGDAGLRKGDAAADAWADAVSLPTPLYEQDSAPILAGLGTKGGFPVANISQFAARQFTKWLSARTGHFYRLPTEAEWEYAARAGSASGWSFGDDPAELDQYAVYFDNSLYEDPAKGHPDFGAGYRKVGSKQPNAWGLFDMHGNVAEWVLDGYDPAHYGSLSADGVDALAAVRWPTTIFPTVVRGGSWESDAADTRSAARLASSPQWQDRDPQLPKSIWWFTDGFHVGFRVVRPLEPPPPEQRGAYWETTDVGTLEILEAGGKQVRAPVGRSGGGD